MIRAVCRVDDVNIFYREAGPRSAPTVLLLHGFAGSSYMYRDVIAALADSYHVIAPDLPSFGYTQAPARGAYDYTFANLTHTMDRLTEQLKLDRYALVVHDYGAPIGWRLAAAHPERITALISQNGNAYEEGLSTGWDPIRTYWQSPTAENRAALADFPTAKSVKWQFFLPAGAEAWKRDIPGAQIHFYDTGHFALETHAAQIIPVIREFLDSSVAEPR